MRSHAFILSAALILQSGSAEASLLGRGKSLCESLLRTIIPRKSESKKASPSSEQPPVVSQAASLIRSARQENLKKPTAEKVAETESSPQNLQSSDLSSARPLFKPQIERRNTNFVHLDDLMRAFSQGLIPKLGDQEQMQAYQIYLATYFGSSTQYQPDSFSLDTMEEEYQKHPEFLQQMRFRNAKIEVHASEMVALPPDLKEATDRILRKAKVNAGKLLNIEANSGFYRKILLDSDGSELEQALPASAREQIADKNTPIATRANQLFSLLNKERKRLASRNLDSPGLRQTLVDLIHVTAVLDSNSQDFLASHYSHLRLAGLTRVMQLRDSIAMVQGYDDHFAQVLRDNGVASPSGEERPDEMNILIRRIQAISELNAVDEEDGHEYTVRQLSLFEKPFRSCVGGSDCSSTNYFEFGLDPNVQYFTMTDGKGRSQGQMTLVFGSVLDNGVAKPAAFLDKIQNVPNSAILPMLDAIAASIGEYGYQLLLPFDPGNHNGISNDDFTRDAYRAVFVTLPKQDTLTAFVKDGPDYGYTSYFSRHHRNIEVMAYSRSKTSKLSTKLLKADVPWTVDSMDRSALIQNMMELRKGTWSEKMRFVLLMPLIEEMGLQNRILNLRIVMAWFSDPKAPYRFRSDLLLYAMSDIHRMATRLPEMRKIALGFSEEERRHLIDRLDQSRHALSVNVDSDLFLLSKDHPEWVRSFTKHWNYLHLRDAGYNLRMHLKPLNTFRPHLLVAADGLLQTIPDDLRTRLSDELFLESVGIQDELKRIMAGHKFSEAQKIEILKGLFLKAGAISGFDDFVFSAPKAEVEYIRKVLLENTEIRALYKDHKEAQKFTFGHSSNF